MFERFNEQARRTLFFSRYEASQLGSKSIMPEHMLLGLLRESGGTFGDVLTPEQREQVRAAIRDQVPFEEQVDSSVEIPFSAAATRVLQRTAAEANLMQHEYIGAEHLLLALLDDEASLPARALTSCGFGVEALRQQFAKPVPQGPADAQLKRLELQVQGIIPLVGENQQAVRRLEAIARELKSLRDIL